MAADIHQVDGKPVLVDVVIAERVAAKFGRWHEQPVGRRTVGPLLGQDGEHIARRVCQLGLEPSLGLFQQQVLFGELILDGLAVVDRRLVEHLQVVVIGAQGRKFGPQARIVLLLSGFRIGDG